NRAAAWRRSRAAATSPAPLPPRRPTAAGLGVELAPKWPAGGYCSRPGIALSHRRAGWRNARPSDEDTAASRVTGLHQAEVRPKAALRGERISRYEASSD